MVDVEGAALHRKIEYEKWEAANGAATLLALDLVVHEGGLPVQLAATPGRVNRLTVPEGVSVHDLGHVLVGRQRAHSGELVVEGRLLPEQREAVNRMATLITFDGWTFRRVRSRTRCWPEPTSPRSRGVTGAPS